MITKQNGDTKRLEVPENTQLCQIRERWTLCTWVLYATNEASNFTSESGDVLYGD